MPLQATPVSSPTALHLQCSTPRALTSNIGQTSWIAVVLSTLLIVTFFRAARRRVMIAPDRRFFPQQYDAQKVMGEFAATERDEIHLDTQTPELLRMIQETMQPATRSIWLRDPASVKGDMIEQRHSVAEETFL